MAHKWVLDVLEDLKSFAQTNELPALAKHLDEGLLIAAAEIATEEGQSPKQRPTTNSSGEGDIGRLG